MRFNQIICFVLFLLITSKTFASVSIQEKVLIDSPIIKLGNIFNGLPESIANEKIGNSPEPGQQKIIRLKLIKKLASNFNIDWKSNSTIESITIRRSSRGITSEELENDIINEINKNRIPSEYIIQIKSNHLIGYIPINSDYKVEIIHLSYNEKTERFFANIKIMGNDFSPLITNLKGFARSVVNIPILNNKISKGQILNNNDIKIIKIAKNRININYLTSIDDIIGMEASRNLRKGSPLKKIDLRNIRLVEKGKAVSLFIKSELMTIKTVGQSLDHGSLGDHIRVLNPRSRKIISGIVTGKNEVRIPSNNNISFLQSKN
ncbi:MAG: flagella basal body P-ring formation protein FlgA [Rhodospirillaceae bacterium]|nr:flagella basal body P-ring formation protein FlgA [Rhodospirillaceae bacterium]|tara:strand:- start:446 stop:1405 length:960 start_codon:yes stop_codon:yes gene_type:complete